MAIGLYMAALAHAHGLDYDLHALHGLCWLYGDLQGTQGMWEANSTVRQFLQDKAEAQRAQI